MNHSVSAQAAHQDYAASEAESIGLPELAKILGRQWRLLVASSIAVGVIAYGISHLIPPTFTSRTLFVPPQQQSQSAAASALASLGALAGLAGAGGTVKSSADQYVSLLQSTNVSNRIIDKFDLMKIYEAKYRVNAQKRLLLDVRITLGKKDGLITIEVDAPSPQLAADMANQYVEELRRLTGEFALGEAKQRRVFFEGELGHTKQRLAQAQLALQRGGFNAGALKAEPKAAAEDYAKLRAEVTGAEVRLQTMRNTLANGSPQLQQQVTTVDALRSQLRKLEASAGTNAGDADYVGSYREYKYQETMFEVFSRQYELARLDESKEGSLVQVVDVATPAELKSKPKRSMIALGSSVAFFLLMSVWVIGRHLRHRSKAGF